LAEVGHTRAPILAQEHVAGLEVAVHEPCGMGGRQALARGEHHVDHLAPARVSLGPPRREIAAFDQLGGHEHAPLEHAHVVHADDVGVGQSGQRLGFTAQALVIGRGGHAAVQELERHLAIELRVERGHHHACGTAPHGGQHGVPPHHRARGWLEAVVGALRQRAVARPRAARGDLGTIVSAEHRAHSTWNE
jgi:hypothetical protein